jgi:predicted transcriptional regulator
MKISEIVSTLEGEIVCGEDKLDCEVDDFAASDLLSDILAFSKENYVLLTGLTNAQIVRTSEITNARCIVILRNKKPQPAAVALARRAGIPMILSPFGMFDACCRLSRFLEKKADGGTP